VYVSQDDGATWQSLQNNLPSTSIRDLVVHGNDVVVGTHGRSFWILDDIQPLRDAAFPKAAAANAPYLFQPADAYRLRRDAWTDTPLPPEEPAGENPPDGATLDYYLPSASSVTIAIYDAAGHLVRKYTSSASPVPVDPEINVPTYWVAPSNIPSGSAGMHRFVWNYRYADPLAVSHDYPISAIEHETPRVPQGVLALPGSYRVVLTAGGHSVSRTVRLRMDPRVTVSAAALKAKYELASQIVSLMNRTYALAKKNQRYAQINDQLSGLLDAVEGADAQPTPQLAAAVAAIERQLSTTAHR
jgi:hypothetical protein